MTLRSLGTSLLTSSTHTTVPFVKEVFTTGGVCQASAKGCTNSREEPIQEFVGSEGKILLLYVSCRDSQCAAPTTQPLTPPLVSTSEVKEGGEMRG